MATVAAPAAVLQRVVVLTAAALPVLVPVLRALAQAALPRAQPAQAMARAVLPLVPTARAARPLLVAQLVLRPVRATARPVTVLAPLPLRCGQRTGASRWPAATRSA